MSHFILLAGCLLAGLVLRRAGRVAEGGHQVLNAVIIHLALPAVSLRTLHRFSFDAGQWWPVLMPWMLFALGAGLFRALGRWLRLPNASIGALTLVGGLGNTSFVGLPMIESLQGREGLGVGLLIDQLGSYLALSTLGILLASFYAAEGRPTVRTLATRVLGFPPFVALVLALLLRPLPFPAPLDGALARVGDMLTPLALLSVGMQLRLEGIGRQWRSLCLGLGYKLVACPALVLFVLWATNSGANLVDRVSLIEAAMPPMIGAGIVAAQARLDAPLASTLIGVGIPLGLVTAPLWFWLMQRVS